MSPAARALLRGMGLGPTSTRTEATAPGVAASAMSDAAVSGANLIRCRALPCAAIVMDTALRITGPDVAPLCNIGAAGVRLLASAQVAQAGGDPARHQQRRTGDTPRRHPPGDRYLR